jgi:heme exporter protein D
MNSYTASTYAFLDGLRLEIRASERTLRHYRAEYGGVASEREAPPNVLISFQRRPEGHPLRFSGGHRSLRWHVELDQSTSETLRATVALRGEPRSFGLSLLQGYLIEPLVELAAPAVSHVLLPAAAIGGQRGAILILGRSRSGKSSTAARAAAAGQPVLGDDHVLVASDGTCRPFPRRLRLYSDLAATAPAAYALLAPSQRAVLRGLAAVRALTRGAVAPPLRIPIEALGAPAAQPAPLRGVVLIQRADIATIVANSLSLSELVELAYGIVADQRRALEEIADEEWRERLRRAQANEEALLESAFAAASFATRLLVPNHWPAGRAIESVAAHLANAMPTEPSSALSH